MAAEPYLVQLNTRLAEELANWPDPRKQAHADFLLARQDPTGGFVGRAGAPDLYYTAFALRGLAVLERLKPEAAFPAARFLMRQTPAGIVDFLSYLFCWRLLAGRPPAPDPATRAVFGELLESRRCADGGYGKSPNAAAASTYHTFLAGLCYDLLGERFPQPERIAGFVRGRRRADGGFAELEQMPHGSINPTAAGAALALATGAADEEMVDGVVRFLLTAQREEGGWPASARAPAGDLLSTFTALLTLSDFGALDQADHAGARRFLAACRGPAPAATQADSAATPPAGFRASPIDSQADVEYTFYGLGCLAVLGAVEL